METVDPTPAMGVQEAAKGGLRFLIVDEDTYYSGQLRHLILRASGQRDGVEIVGTISDALTALEEQAFDVCFLDFGLAERTGLDTKEIERLGKMLTATIFISEKPSKHSALHALNVGAKDFLIKSNMSDFDIAKSISYGLYWKYREIEMEALSVRDNVTGLGNLLLFDEHLRHAMDVAKRGREKVGLLMIGLNGLEPVYEDYGHDVRDELLKQVGQRISKKVRSTDVVARLSEKEFGTVLIKVASPSVVETISGTISGVVSNEPYDIDGLSLKIGAVVGASTYPDDGEDLGSLKDRAKANHKDKVALKPFRPNQDYSSTFDYYKR